MKIIWGTFSEWYVVGLNPELNPRSNIYIYIRLVPLASARPKIQILTNSYNKYTINIEISFKFPKIQLSIFHSFIKFPDHKLNSLTFP